MRRDKNDKQWQDTKAAVDKLDNNECACCKCLSAGEMSIFIASKPARSISLLQHAHRKPVSQHPDVMYNTDNVYLLCAEHHYRIDHFLDLITGQYCSQEEHEAWWNRVAASREKKQQQALPEFFY